MRSTSPRLILIWSRMCWGRSERGIAWARVSVESDLGLILRILYISYPASVRATCWAIHTNICELDSAFMPAWSAIPSVPVRVNKQQESESFRIRD